MSIDIRNFTPADGASDSQRPDDVSFAETALRLGGKSADEARRTGLIDTADDQVETMFAERHRTTASPIHRAVWERRVPTDLFHTQLPPMADEVRQMTNDCLHVVRKHKREGSLYDESDKLSNVVLTELGGAGYWGALVDKRYGGCGLSFQHFASFLTRMATIEPTVAGRPGAV